MGNPVDPYHLNVSYEQEVNFLFQGKVNETTQEVATLEKNVETLSKMNGLLKEQIAIKTPDSSPITKRMNFFSDADPDKLKMIRKVAAAGAKVRESIGNIHKDYLYENMKMLMLATQYMTEKNKALPAPITAIPVFEMYEHINDILLDKSVLQTVEAKLICEQIALIAELKYLTKLQ